MFQRSVLKRVKKDEGIVALRWAKFQEYLAKKEFVEKAKKLKFADKEMINLDLLSGDLIIQARENFFNRFGIQGL